MKRLLSRLQDAWKFALGKPLLPEGLDDSIRRREASMLLTSLSMVVMRVVSFSINIISIGVLHRYLDPVAFGLWLTLSSFWLVLVLFGDMGMAGSVVNGVARAAAASDDGAARRIVSSTLPILVAITSTLSLVFLALAWLMPWADILNIREPHIAAQFPVAFVAMALSTACTPLLGLAPAVLKGLQRGYVGNLLGSAGFAGALLALLLSTQNGLSFSAVAVAFYAVPVAWMTLVGIAYFLFVNPRLRPSVALIEPARMRQALSVGGALFGLQIFSSVTSFSDSILISMVLGPEQVQSVAVPARLFATINLGVAIFLVPLWPAYADAIARGDVNWVRRTFRRSLLLAAGISVAGALVVFAFHEPILRVWMGKGFEAERAVVIGLAVWCVIESMATAIAMLLNAAQVFRFQLITAGCMMVASIGLRVLLLREIGPSGVPMASIAAYAVTTFIPLCFFLRKIVRSIGERSGRA